MLDGIPPHAFSVIMATPPFTASLCKAEMSLGDRDLCALPVNKIAAESSLLLMWCNGATLMRAAWLCHAWGFTYETVAFVWVKTSERAEPLSVSDGKYTNPGTEFVLVATKGAGFSLIAEHLDQVFAAPRSSDSVKTREMRVMIDEMTGRDSNLRKIDLFSPTPADTKWSVWGDMVEEMSVVEPQEPQEPEKPQAPQETKALTGDEQQAEPTDKEDNAPDHQKTDPSDGTNTHQKQVTSAASVLCSSAPQKSEDDAATRRRNLRTRLELTVGQKLALAELSSFQLNENQEASFDFQRCLIRHSLSDPRHVSHTDVNHREYSGRDQLDQRALGLDEGQALALGEFGSWRRNHSA
jgi:N6-adenosine-specific RNA methylase IME4